jgi:DNA primase
MQFDAIVELIKDRLDITDALSIYAGANFSKVNLNRSKVSIRCPFHQDSSPSLSVYLNDNRFRCWRGCNDGKPGDCIDVVKLIFGLSTAEAVKKLTDDLNIDSTEADPETTERIAENRRIREKVKADQEKLNWAFEALTWLKREIPKQSKLIKTHEELELWAPLIHAHSIIEYKLDCLVGTEETTEWEKVKIIEWTSTLAREVRQINESVAV